jgi:hypothetical protein
MQPLEDAAVGHQHPSTEGAYSSVLMPFLMTMKALGRVGAIHGDMARAEAVKAFSYQIRRDRTSKQRWRRMLSNPMPLLAVGDDLPPL